jgi:hypothetical protein
MQLSSLPYVFVVQPIISSYSLLDCHLLKHFCGKTLGKPHKSPVRRPKRRYEVNLMMNLQNKDKIFLVHREAEV